MRCLCVLTSTRRTLLVHRGPLCHNCIGQASGLKPPLATWALPPPCRKTAPWLSNSRPCSSALVTSRTSLTAGTQHAGRLGPIPLPEEIATTSGHYDVLALLPEDNTFARGSLFMLAPGTKCVLFDMDGTITVGDQEVVAQFALSGLALGTEAGEKAFTESFDQKARAHARSVARLWAAKGYQVVYLSGRQVRLLAHVCVCRVCVFCDHILSL